MEDQGGVGQQKNNFMLETNFGELLLMHKPRGSQTPPPPCPAPRRMNLPFVQQSSGWPRWITSAKVAGRWQELRVADYLEERLLDQAQS